MRKVITSFLLGSLIAFVISFFQTLLAPAGFLIGGFIGGLSFGTGRKVGLGYGIGFILPGLVIPLLLIAIQGMSGVPSWYELILYPVGFGIAFGLAGFTGGAFLKRGIRVAAASAASFGIAGAIAGIVIVLALLFPVLLMGATVVAFVVSFVGGGIFTARHLAKLAPVESTQLTGVRWENIVIAIFTVLFFVIGIAFVLPFFQKRQPQLPTEALLPKNEEWPTITEHGEYGNHYLTLTFYGQRSVPENFSGFASERYGKLQVIHNGKSVPEGTQSYADNYYSTRQNIGSGPEHREGLWEVGWDYAGKEYSIQFMIGPESPTSKRCIVKQKKRSAIDLVEKLMIVPNGVCRSISSYVAMGSSPTQGAGSSKPENRGYVSLITQQLRKISPDLRTFNLGDRGLSGNHFLQQLPKIREAKPDLITFWPLYDYEVTQSDILRIQLSEILDSLQKEDTAVFLGDYQLNESEVCKKLGQGNCWERQFYEKTRAKNEIVSFIAGERPFVFLIPLFDPGIAHTERVPGNKYPNDVGHLYIAAEFWKAISNWLTSC